MIDGRWIDTVNGKYIDITALNPEDGGGDFFYCKDGHRYSSDDLFPLQSARLGQADIMIPLNYKAILLEEYGHRVLTKARFHW